MKLYVEHRMGLRGKVLALHLQNSHNKSNEKQIPNKPTELNL